MPRQLFFDFDGTLVDSRPRLYNLFVELTGDNLLSFDQYWDLKRQGTFQRDILSRHYGYSGEKCLSFMAQWLDKIEEEKRLALDQPFAGVDDMLGQLFKENHMFVVSGRQSRDALIAQVGNLGWAGCFKDILVTAQKNEKNALVENAVKIFPEDIFIGDSGEDILAGRKLGTKTYAVDYGFCSSDILKTYTPDFIFTNIKDLWSNLK